MCTYTHIHVKMVISGFHWVALQGELCFLLKFSSIFKCLCNNYVLDHSDSRFTLTMRK